MIIDRSLDDSGFFADQEAGVTTSPWNSWCFYGNSSSSPEQAACSGSQSPSCNSESGKNWITAGSPGDTSNNIIVVQADSCIASTNRKAAYKGVRVKNTVKELIMQKRGMQVQQFPSRSDHYPALTTVLQGVKRSAPSTPSDMSSPKRSPSLQNDQATALSALLNNVTVPFSCANMDDPLKDNVQASGLFLGIPDIVHETRELPPVSLTTVQVKESPCHQQPTPAHSPPSVSFPPQSQESLVCLANDTAHFANDTVPSYSSSEALSHCLNMHSQVPCYQPEGTGSPGLPSSSSPPPFGFPLGQSGPALSLSQLSTHTSGGMSFFQWQIQQEEDKLMGLTQEQLMTPDADGDTFLHIAVAQGRRALAYVLARRMARAGTLDMKEHNSQSALQVGVAANQHLIVQDLLTLGAQINTADHWGRSPLHVCAEKGHAVMLKAIQKTLQSSGQQVDMEAINYDGLTALHVAVLSHNAVLQELDQGDSPHCRRSEELLQRRKLLGECVSTLLAMGASYRTKDGKSGRTALHIAAEEANVELLRLFLDQPDSLSVINVKAYNGNTALHVASSLQGRVAQLDAVKMLMRRGADPSAKNLENEQPAQLVPEGSVGDQVRRILKGKSAQVRYSPF